VDEVLVLVLAQIKWLAAVVFDVVDIEYDPSGCTVIKSPLTYQGLSCHLYNALFIYV
jgi:hypothetical protein